MSEKIELDRLALIIGHQQINLALQQDQISALMAQLAKLQKPQATGPREVKPDAE